VCSKQFLRLLEVETPDLLPNVNNCTHVSLPCCVASLFEPVRNTEHGTHHHGQLSCRRDTLYDELAGAMKSVGVTQ